MKNQILQFYLSNHFMLQGWNRSIDTTVLYKILPEVSIGKAKKKLAIITPSLLHQKGVPSKRNEGLILVLKERLIATAYWCDHPNYLFDKEKNSEFQILY